MISKVEQEPIVKPVRCAIYTRKSTREGLDYQEFTTLDNQRELAEKYAELYKQKGWIVKPDQYDDGGFTGGDMDRPALQRLLKDVEAGLIDCIIVYRLDRLTRSILDFSRIFDILERHEVSFVSVTEQMDTSTSLGRLMLNILLSFAQFERELISERTRDKIAATRRKGKWTGGMPMLGYDVLPDAGGLQMNEAEAKHVQSIFNMYLKHKGLIPTVQELKAKGWTTKKWITRRGNERGGKPFTKNNLYRLLTNIIYVGKISYKDEIYEGEHEGIVDPEVFQKVQQTLKKNYRTGSEQIRCQSLGALKGLLYCDMCGCAMTHTYTKKGNKLYRYYVCQNAMKNGYSACPGKLIPAQQVEKYIIDKVRCIGQDEKLINATVRKIHEQSNKRKEELDHKRRALAQELQGEYKLLNTLMKELDTGTTTAEHILPTQKNIDALERQTTEIDDEIINLERPVIKQGEIENFCTEFDQVWDALTVHEQRRLLGIVVKKVSYNKQKKTATVIYRETCMKALADELGNRKEVSK